MAVQEVGIPSGFEVDVESIERPDVLKRTEREDRKIILYFDEVRHFSDNFWGEIPLGFHCSQHVVYS